MAKAITRYFDKGGKEISENKYKKLQSGEQEAEDQKAGKQAETPKPKTRSSKRKEVKDHA